MKAIAIKFQDYEVPKFYNPQDEEYEVGDFCVVETKDGEEFAKVAAKEMRCPYSNDLSLLPKILRKATEEEIKEFHDLRKQERDAHSLIKKKLQTHQLPMKISRVHILPKRKKVIFYFTADKRLDFRELVKDLAADLKTRIELWQIGVRDEAKMIGGYGVCGKQTCCSSFLKEFKPITTKLAREQDIVNVAPSKISGLCGRLFCCLTYEHPIYQDMAKNLPIIGSEVATDKFKGKIIDRNVFLKTFVIQLEDEQRIMIKHSEIKEVISMPVVEEVVVTEDQVVEDEEVVDTEEPDIYE